VTDLVIVESRHEAIEEHFFWPMVRSSLPDGEELVNRGLSQENAAKQVLHALDKVESNQSDFEEMVCRVNEGREHIEYEQTQVWPKVQAAVSQQDLEELGEKIAKSKKTAPTRTRRPVLLPRRQPAGRSDDRQDPRRGHRTRPRLRRVTGSAHGLMN
jgi:hemerythrin-like domain-containing protein